MSHKTVAILSNESPNLARLEVGSGLQLDLQPGHQWHLFEAPGKQPGLAERMITLSAPTDGDAIIKVWPIYLRGTRPDSKAAFGLRNLSLKHGELRKLSDPQQVIFAFRNIADLATTGCEIVNAQLVLHANRHDVRISPRHILRAGKSIEITGTDAIAATMADMQRLLAFECSIEIGRQVPQ